MHNLEGPRPPHERPVAISYARSTWPRAFGVAADALGVAPSHASTGILDSRLILFLWGPGFDVAGVETEMAGMAAITGPLTAVELDAEREAEAWQVVH